MLEVVGSTDDKKEFSEIINELLSPTEKIMIAKRVAIIYLLMKKIDYLTISDVLKVSSTTITKFHFTMIKGWAIKNALNGLVGSEKIKDFFEKLFYREPGTYGVNWKSAWRQKFAIERKQTRGI